MVENNRCGFVLAFATAIIPIVPSTALAPKLAVAEKHMGWFLFCKIGYVLKFKKNYAILESNFNIVSHKDTKTTKHLRLIEFSLCSLCLCGICIFKIKNMKTFIVSRFILVMCMSAGSMIAMSQATRTWVSGVGDDLNPCSRTAPCKTLAGAISKTATGGEINVLDPGGFGAVTITKSITIDGGGVIGSILSSATNGIIVNAPDGLVTIRNFSINGAGTTLGINGIRVMAVKKLTVENCTLSNFSGNGIDFNSTTAADIIVSNTSIQNASDGISYAGPSGSTGPAGFTVIDRCHIQSIQNTGVNIGSGTATVSNSVISGCGTGVGSKTGAAVHLSGNVITNNATALKGPGTITSAKNNSVMGNAAQGVTATVVNQQ